MIQANDYFIKAQTGEKLTGSEGLDEEKVYVADETLRAKVTEDLTALGLTEVDDEVIDEEIKAQYENAKLERAERIQSNQRAANMAVTLDIANDVAKDELDKMLDAGSTANLVFGDGSIVDMEGNRTGANVSQRTIAKTMVEFKDEEGEKQTKEFSNEGEDYPTIMINNPEYVNKEGDMITQFKYSEDYSHIVPIYEGEDTSSKDEIVSRWDLSGLTDIQMESGVGRSLLSTVPRAVINTILGMGKGGLEFAKSALTIGARRDQLKDSTAYKAVVDGTNWAKAYQVSSSDESRTDSLTVENVAGLVANSVAQLSLGSGIGALAGALSKSAVVGSAASRFVQTAYAVADSADESRALGLTEKETAIKFFVDFAAQSLLQNAFHGADKWSARRSTVVNTEKAIQNELARKGTGKAFKELVSDAASRNLSSIDTTKYLISKYGNVVNKMRGAIATRFKSEAMKGAVGESFEEGAEFITQELSNNLWNTYMKTREGDWKDEGDHSKGKYKYEYGNGRFNDILKAGYFPEAMKELGSNMIGGFIGGGISQPLITGASSIKLNKNSDFWKTFAEQYKTKIPDDFKDIVSNAVFTGQDLELKNLVGRMRDKNKFADKNILYDLDKDTGRFKVKDPESLNTQKIDLNSAIHDTIVNQINGVKAIAVANDMYNKGENVLGLHKAILSGKMDKVSLLQDMRDDLFELVDIYSSEGGIDAMNELENAKDPEALLKADKELAKSVPAQTRAKAVALKQKIFGYADGTHYKNALQEVAFDEHLTALNKSIEIAEESGSSEDLIDLKDYKASIKTIADKYTGEGESRLKFINEVNKLAVKSARDLKVFKEAQDLRMSTFSKQVFDSTKNLTGLRDIYNLKKVLKDLDPTEAAPSKADAVKLVDTVKKAKETYITENELKIREAYEDAFNAANEDVEWNEEEDLEAYSENAQHRFTKLFYKHAPLEMLGGAMPNFEDYAVGFGYGENEIPNELIIKMLEDDFTLDLLATEIPYDQFNVPGPANLPVITGFDMLQGVVEDIVATNPDASPKYNSAFPIGDIYKKIELDTESNLNFGTDIGAAIEVLESENEGDLPTLVETDEIEALEQSVAALDAFMTVTRKVNTYSSTFDDYAKEDNVREVPAEITAIQDELQDLFGDSEGFKTMQEEHIEKVNDFRTRLSILKKSAIARKTQGVTLDRFTPAAHELSTAEMDSLSGAIEFIAERKAAVPPRLHDLAAKLKDVINKPAEDLAAKVKRTRECAKVMFDTMEDATHDELTALYQALKQQYDAVPPELRTGLSNWWYMAAKVDYEVLYPYVKQAVAEHNLKSGERPTYEQIQSAIQVVALLNDPSSSSNEILFVAGVGGSGKSTHLLGTALKANKLIRAANGQASGVLLSASRARQLITLKETADTFGLYQAHDSLIASDLHILLESGEDIVEKLSDVSTIVIDEATNIDFSDEDSTTQLNVIIQKIRDINTNERANSPIRILALGDVDQIGFVDPETFRARNIASSLFSAKTVPLRTSIRSTVPIADVAIKHLKAGNLDEISGDYGTVKDPNAKVKWAGFAKGSRSNMEGSHKELIAGLLKDVEAVGTPDKPIMAVITDDLTLSWMPESTRLLIRDLHNQGLISLGHKEAQGGEFEYVIVDASSEFGVLGNAKGVLSDTDRAKKKYYQGVLSTSATRAKSLTLVVDGAGFGWDAKNKPIVGVAKHKPGSEVEQIVKLYDIVMEGIGDPNLEDDDVKVANDDGKDETPGTTDGDADKSASDGIPSTKVRT